MPCRSEIELHRPKNLPEALALMGTPGLGVRALSGGTNVVVELRAGRLNCKSLVDLNGLQELRGKKLQDKYVVIGGGTTITELIEHPLIGMNAAILKEAALVFANPLVRNRATVAGNLVDASPAADTAPPLLALNAEVQLMSRTGSRWIKLGDFFTGVRTTLLQPDELMVAIRWPVPSGRSAGAYTKVGLRKADAISVLSAAIMLEFDDNGLCKRAGIALGALAPKPFRAHAAETLLLGQALEPGLIEEAARVAAEMCSPIDDIRSSAAYRKRVTAVTVRRLLVKTAEALI